MTKVLLQVDDVQRRFGGGRTLFGRRRPAVHAVQGVSFTLRRGETLGVVGESGCGKSTLGRLIVGLDVPSAGRILLDGDDLSALAHRSPARLAQRVQLVFQDPIASLNPRRTIRQILEAPLKHLRMLSGTAREERLAELLDAVNLSPAFLERYPHEFSGGQAQRIGIARALAADPELIVLDEPVSALDVSVQAQVLNLLDDLKTRFSLTYLFISHDLAVVESVSDRVAVMYFGRIVELGRTEAVFAHPAHPYTHLLRRSAPAPGRRSLPAESGSAELPDPYAPPPGCAFHARCPRRSDRCRTENPVLAGSGREGAAQVACFHPFPD